MADVKQMEKIVPLITYEISLRQYVCELVFGVNVFDLVFGVQIESVKQPINSNSVGSGYVSHCWTSAFDDHSNHACLQVWGSGVQFCSLAWPDFLTGGHNCTTYRGSCVSTSARDSASPPVWHHKPLLGRDAANEMAQEMLSIRVQRVSQTRAAWWDMREVASRAHVVAPPLEVFSRNGGDV